MKIKRYENLYQLTFLSTIFPINCYIWENKDSLFVIDMGVKEFVKPIKKISNELGKPVTKLLLTHAHSDHVNGVPYFLKGFPTAEIGISKRDALLLKKDFHLKQNESPKKIKGGFSKKEIPINFTFVEQDTFDTLEVINSSGHTPGSISFFDPTSKILIAGDAFQIRGGVNVSGTLNVFFPFPALATWDSVTALESAKKLLQLNPSLLAVGHGSMLINPANQMKKAIHTAERKQKIEKKSR